MSDLFHESVLDEWIDAVMDVIQHTPQHAYQILTKRPKRMEEYLKIWYASRAKYATGNCLPNLWLGVSVENQKAAEERIPALMSIPAAVRFLSCEPLLGPVDLKNVAFETPYGDRLVRDAMKGTVRPQGSGLVEAGFNMLDWVIAGGESGPNARPMHPDWARSLRDQCKAASVPFFFKQWGEWAPLGLVKGVRGSGVGEFLSGNFIPKQISCPVYFKYNPKDQHQHMLKLGKKNAGRMLDGMVWSEMPK